MSTEVLQVQKRTARGTRHVSRLRGEGRVPAVLYGHGAENVLLTATADQVLRALRRHAHLVELQGDVNETALLKAVQWDTFGQHVLHIDLARVSKGESADAVVSVELRGDAAGTKEGGIVEQVTRELRLHCPVTAIPDVITVKVTDLHLGGAIYARDVELPAGAKLLTTPDTMIVHCVAPAGGGEEAAVASPAEPEVIARKKAEEGEAG